MSPNDFTDAFVEVLLRAYARNSGNSFDDHYNQDAARQWMHEALKEAAVCSAHQASDICRYCEPRWTAFTARLTRDGDGGRDG